MNKLNLKKLKSVFNWILIVLIIVANILLLFYPQYSKNKNSFVNLKEKKEIIGTNDMEIQIGYGEIDKKKKELIQKITEGGEAEIKEKLLKQNINLEGLKLHIPSMLIEFEQKARFNKIDMVVRYDLIKKSSEINIIPEVKKEVLNIPKENPNKKEKTNSEKKNEEYEEIKEEEIELDWKGGSEVPNINTPLTKTNEVYNHKSSENNTLTTTSYFDTENNLETVLTTKDLPKINGLEVTIIPLEVTGSYEGVRSYLRYLDTIDYIEPAFVELNSVGDTMHGVIVLYILHTIK